MKTFILFLIFLASTQSNANENFLKNSSESLNYVFSPNNSEAYLGVSLQLEDNYNNFLFNLKLNIFEGFGDAKNHTIFSLIPGLGYMLIGDSNSKHKLNIKLSAGLASFTQNDKMNNGFGSETSLEYRFKSFAFSLGYMNLNPKVMNNEYILIGFRYYN